MLQSELHTKRRVLSYSHVVIWGLSRIEFMKVGVRRDMGSVQKRQTPNLGFPKAGIDRHLFKVKGHRHYLIAEMNIIIHSRHSTVSAWLRSPGFFLDHCFVSYV